MSQTVQLFKKEDLGMVRILGDKDNPLFCLNIRTYKFNNVKR